MVRAMTSAAPSMSATTRRASAVVRPPEIGAQTQLDLVRVDGVDVKVDGHLRGADGRLAVEQWRAGGP